MVSEMQLVITENKQIVKTLTKETNAQGSNLVKSLQEFQQLVNAAITQIIEDRGDGIQDDTEELNDESSENEEDDIPVTPKKKRK